LRNAILLAVLAASLARADVYTEQESFANALGATLSAHFQQNVTFEKVELTPTKPRWYVDFRVPSGTEYWQFQVRKLGDYFDSYSASRESNGIWVTWEAYRMGTPNQQYHFEFHCLKNGRDFQAWSQTDWINLGNFTNAVDVSTQACLDFQGLPEETPTPSTPPTPEPTEQASPSPEPALTIEPSIAPTPETPTPSPSPLPSPSPSIASPLPTKKPSPTPKEKPDDPVLLAVAGVALAAGFAAVIYYGGKD